MEVSFFFQVLVEMRNTMKTSDTIILGLSGIFTLTIFLFIGMIFGGVLWKVFVWSVS